MIGIGTPRIQSRSPREKFMTILLGLRKVQHARQWGLRASVGNLTHFFVVGSIAGNAGTRIIKRRWLRR
jgi:hypothetical protein